MADIKRYVVTWFDTLSLIIDIDHDIVSNELLAQINAFWSDAADRLNNADGDVLVAVLKMLGQRCWQLVIAHGYSEQALIREFNEGMEGWPKMDGSSGFRIIQCDELEFDECDISVEEVPF